MVRSLRTLVCAVTVVAAAGCDRPSTPASPPSPVQRIYVFPHTHLDLGYTAAPSTIAPRYKRIVDDALDYVDAHPEMYWTVESTWQLEQWLARTPEPARVAHFFDRVREGRIMLSASYANLHQTYGDEQATRLTFASRRLAETHGVPPPVVSIHNDVGGYSFYLPQALAGAGVPYALIGANQQLGALHGIPREHVPFYWEGPDGSRVLTYVALDTYTEGIFAWHLHGRYETFAEAVEQQLGRLREATYPFDVLAVNLAFDNWNLVEEDEAAGKRERWMDAVLRNVAAWNASHQAPQFVIATPDVYFREVESRYGPRLATYRGDWSGFWEHGKLFVPAAMAAKRWAQEHLPVAEKLASLVRVVGTGTLDPSETLFEATQSMLRFDEHSIAGWRQRHLTAEEIRRGNREHVAYATDARAAVRDALDTALDGLARTVRTRGAAIVVVNPLSWTRTDVARVELPPEFPRGPFTLRDAETGAMVPYDRDGSTMTFVARDVPSIGYRRYDVDPTPPPHPTPPPAEAAGVIANETYRVAVDPVDGQVVSVRGSRELVDDRATFPFDGLIVATPNAADGLLAGPVEIVPTVPGEVTVERPASAIGARLVVRRARSPLRETELALYAGVPRVEIRHVLDPTRMRRVSFLTRWEQYLLAFPWALDPTGLRLRFEIQNTIVSPPEDCLPGTNQGSFVVQRAIDLREGDAFGITVAQREPVLDSVGQVNRWAKQFAPSEATLVVRLLGKLDEIDTIDRGVVPAPFEPDDVAPLRFDVSVRSSERLDPVALVHHGAEWAVPLLAHPVAGRQDGPLDAPARSLFALDQPNVVLQTIKRADFGDRADLVLRLREVAGRETPVVRVSTPVRVRSARLATLTETALSAELAIDPITLGIRPHQTVTIRVAPLRQRSREAVVRSMVANRDRHRSQSAARIVSSQRPATASSPVALR